MAGRGGPRANAGRKPKPTKPAAVSKNVADEILDFLALDKDKIKHKKGCCCLKCRWRALATAKDLRLRFQVEKSLMDRVLGLPSQAVTHKGELTLNLDAEIRQRLVNGRKRLAGEQ
jgi:hypothetical protein